MSVKRSPVLVLIAAVILFVGVAVGHAIAYQPEMQAALQNLNSAKAHLQSANDNKSGHRTYAIRLINQAVVQVQLGIDAANRR